MTDKNDETEELNKPAHVVMLVHGINDFATWSKMIQTTFNEESDVVVLPTGYGFYPVWKFLSPPIIRGVFVWFAKREVVKQYRSVKDQYEDAKISVIAHSFGTYLVTQALLKNKDLRFHRVILCGSVVSRNFKWELIADQIGAKPTNQYLVNDCGNGDHWPMMGRKVGWGYGDIGTNGASNAAYVTDRYHNGNHGLFLKNRFVKEYWVPFIADGRVVEGTQLAREKLKWYWRWLARIPLLRWILLLVLAGICFFIFWLFSFLLPLWPAAEFQPSVKEELVVKPNTLVPTIPVHVPDEEEALEFQGTAKSRFLPKGQPWNRTKSDLRERIREEFGYEEEEDFQFTRFSVLLTNLKPEKNSLQILPNPKYEAVPLRFFTAVRNPDNTWKVQVGVRLDIMADTEGNSELLISPHCREFDNYPDENEAFGLLELFDGRKKLEWTK